MNLQADINWIVNEISKIKDPELITIFKNILKYRAKKDSLDWWDQITPEERAEIESAEKEIESGSLLTHQQVMDNPRKWH